MTIAATSRRRAALGAASVIAPSRCRRGPRAEGRAGAARPRAAGTPRSRTDRQGRAAAAAIRRRGARRRPPAPSAARRRSRILERRSWRCRSAGRRERPGRSGRRGDRRTTGQRLSRPAAAAPASRRLKPDALGRTVDHVGSAFGLLLAWTLGAPGPVNLNLPPPAPPPAQPAWSNFQLPVPKPPARPAWLPPSVLPDINRASVPTRGTGRSVNPYLGGGPSDVICHDGRR